MKTNKEYDELNSKYLTITALLDENTTDDLLYKQLKRFINQLLLQYLDDLKHDKVPSDIDKLRCCLDYVSKFSTWEKLCTRVKVAGCSSRPVALHLSGGDLIIELE
jgi:hypothetical protein